VSADDLLATEFEEHTALAPLENGTMHPATETGSTSVTAPTLPPDTPLTANT